METQEQVDKTLTTYELAQRWGMASKTLEVWRMRKKGPPFFKLGEHARARVMYRMKDILAYEEKHLKNPSKPA